MSETTEELLIKLQKQLAEMDEKMKRLESNQIKVAEAEHKNWHMLADKLNQYDLVLHKIFGKKEEK